MDNGSAQEVSQSPTSPAIAETIKILKKKATVIASFDKDYIKIFHVKISDKEYFVVRNINHHVSGNQGYNKKYCPYELVFSADGRLVEFTKFYNPKEMSEGKCELSVLTMNINARFEEGRLDPKTSYNPDYFKDTKAKEIIKFLPDQEETYKYRQITIRPNSPDNQTKGAFNKKGVATIWSEEISALKSLDYPQLAEVKSKLPEPITRKSTRILF